MSTVLCIYWSRSLPSGPGTCSLNLYGGKPYIGNCQTCQRAGHNTPAAAAALFSDASRTHPPTAPRISGCCDRADQA